MRLFVLAALAVALSASSASASILGSFLRKGPIGDPILNNIEDRDAEYVIKGDGNTDMTRFEVGDQVKMYLAMESITSSDGFFAGTPIEANNPMAGGTGYELLARGTFTVTNISDVDANGRARFDFAGDVEFRENDQGLSFDFTQGIAATDALFDNAANQFVMTIGTAAGSDDYITALSAPVNFGDIPTFGTAVDADFGLSLLAGGQDLGLVPDSLPGFLGSDPTGTFHTITGSTQTFANANLGSGNGIGDDLFDLRTNTDINVLAQVPEPGSMAIFAGLALCGVSLRARRRAV